LGFGVVALLESKSQSYDFYSEFTATFNASIVVGNSIFSKQKKIIFSEQKNFFSKTH
jgi:hypothetical protein